MISKKFEIIMNESIKRANVLKHEYLTLENVFLSMLADNYVVRVLEECGANIDLIKIDLESFINEEENFSILNDSQIEVLTKRQFVNKELRTLAQENGVYYQPEISLTLQRVLQQAAIHVQSSGKKEIKGINILVSIFQESKSYSLYLIKKQGIGRFDVIKKIGDNIYEYEEDTIDELSEEELLGAEKDDDFSRNNNGEKKTFLEKFSTNLNEMAREGKIDSLVGREEEIERILQVILRRRKNNSLLVGEAGVGKTAIVEGMAKRIEEKKVPETLIGTTIYSLDMTSLLAGAKFRGDFEQRFKSVIQDLEKVSEDGKKAILFIDEIHTSIGAGATSGSSMDVSNILKPFLNRGTIRVIGATTYAEYRRFIEKESAFDRRFQKIDINAPSLEETVTILKGLRKKFEEFHQIKISNLILKMAVNLSERYLGERKNPDKSIDIIDEACALNMLREKEKRKSSLGKKEIESVVSKMANIPQISIELKEKDLLKKLNKHLKMFIYGQDHAIDFVSDSIILNKSDLGNENKPIASFLFAGPTGVGKTELANQLSIYLSCNLERIDMSEFMEKHAISKFIGAPPGYVGHDQGGGLTDSIKKNPHSVLLLDEVEKAHPDILNILLQIMDYGKLTDSQARVTSFKNVILIMTTNAGAKEMENGSIGLSVEESSGKSKRNKALKNYFSPEFRNRLDSIIYFNKLSIDNIIKIVEKFLSELEIKLAAKNVELLVNDEVKVWLGEKGFDDKMGARPIERIIGEKIKKKISQELLFGKLVKGGSVTVSIVEDEILLSF